MGGYWRFLSGKATHCEVFGVLLCENYIASDNIIRQTKAYNYN